MSDPSDPEGSVVAGEFREMVRRNDLILKGCLSDQWIRKVCQAIRKILKDGLVDPEDPEMLFE